jgi:hypothetical protein
MAISKKFKHGDIVVIDDNPLQVGRVMKSAFSIPKRRHKAFKACLGYVLSDTHEKEVICEWGDGEIQHIPEKYVRLATKAERILYGKI